MKKGHFVKLTFDGSTIAGSTSISMNIQAEMIEVTSIPGSAEDDGWLHYEYGGVAWGATSDGFYSADVTLVSKIVQGPYLLETMVGEKAIPTVKASMQDIKSFFIIFWICFIFCSE